MNLRIHNHFLKLSALPAMILLLPLMAGADETPAPLGQAGKKPSLEEALKKLKLPGVEINLKERCVDVASTVCLEEGALELIACTKDTKEHESIIMIEALPKHVHTALLLIGAKSGNPAMRKPVDKEATRWMDIPPRGGAVDVSLVFPDKEGKTVERPISDFIVAIEDEYGGAADESKKERFPTNTFVFAGSILEGGKDNRPRTYLCDTSGNVISIATFGDEVLCLPGFNDADNGHLMWEIDSTHLPPLGSKVTLRLRPQYPKNPAAGAEKGPAKAPN